MCSCKMQRIRQAKQTFLYPSTELMNIWGFPVRSFETRNPLRAKFKVSVHACRISASSSWDALDLRPCLAQKAQLI